MVVSFMNSIGWFEWLQLLLNWKSVYLDLDYIIYKILHLVLIDTTLPERRLAKFWENAKDEDNNDA